MSKCIVLHSDILDMQVYKMILNVGWCGLNTGSCTTKKNNDILQLHVSAIQKSIITMGHKIHVVTNGSLCKVRQCF